MLLLVEPSAALRRALTRALYKKLDLATVNDGEEAWEAVNALPEIDVVITELDMPLLDGHGLLARLRGSDSPRLRELPVIVLSDESQTESRRRALQEGANDFLVKPVDATEVVARVELHCRLATVLREFGEARCALAEQTPLDPVTGLCNRRTFFERANKDLSLAHRHGTPLSLVLIAVDGLTEIREAHGTEVADEVLAEIAAWLIKAVRAEETVARIDGEEFVILAPRTDRADAVVMAERIRTGIAAKTTPVDGVSIHATASLGFATLFEDEGTTLEELIALADRRLATARHNGGNQVGGGNGARATTAPRDRAPLPEPGRGPALSDPPVEDLLHQLVPLLEALSRQLGVREILTDLGNGGTANTADPAREDL